jgi:hypothetical protein
MRKTRTIRTCRPTVEGSRGQLTPTRQEDGASGSRSVLVLDVGNPIGSEPKAITLGPRGRKHIRVTVVSQG